MKIEHKEWLTRVSKNEFPAKKSGSEHVGFFVTALQPTREKDNNIIALWVTLIAHMLDKNKKELYRFETEKYFEFTDHMTDEETYKHIYDLYLEAIPDFNEEYSKLESEAKFGAEFIPLNFEKAKALIIRSFLTIYKNK